MVKEIRFAVTTKTIKNFCLMLQKGFMVEAHTGCSISSLLSEQFGFSPDFVVKRVTTVLLDGKPVDDIESAMVTEKSRLALSAAMPGLVGAVLRKESAYASFRRSITHREGSDHCVARQGLIEMKLFNSLMEEMGQEFLKVGIMVEGADVGSFLADRPAFFWEGCKKITLDGKPIEGELLIRTLAGDLSSRVRIVVTPF
jgi:hypothetical protein